MLITVDFVMWNGPCPEYTRERVASLLGDGKTLLECLRCDAVPAADRIWLATRKGACSERVQRLFACWCAEQVLPLFESRHQDDDRPLMAIQVATAYAMGEATLDELDAAREASLGSATEAHTGAASAVAVAAACSAGRDPSCDSAARYSANAESWCASDDVREAKSEAMSSWDARVSAFIELLETHGG